MSRYDHLAKECPFCGHSATVEPQVIEPGWHSAIIMCSVCPAQIIGGGDTEIEAVHQAIWLWNRRVSHA